MWRGAVGASVLRRMRLSVDQGGGLHIAQAAYLLGPRSNYVVMSVPNVQLVTWKPVKGAAGLESSKCTTAPACCRPEMWAGLISIFA